MENPFKMDHLGIMDDRKIQSFDGKSNHKMDHLGVPGLVNVYIANWKIHPNFSWENQLFLWSFSIAMLVITRGYRLFIIIIIHNIDIWLYVIACYNLYNYYNIKHIIILVGGLEHEFYDFPYIENDSPN